MKFTKLVLLFTILLCLLTEAISLNQNSIEIKKTKLSKSNSKQSGKIRKTIKKEPTSPAEPVKEVPSEATSTEPVKEVPSEATPVEPVKEVPSEATSTEPVEEVPSEANSVEPVKEVLSEATPVTAPAQPVASIKSEEVQDVSKTSSSPEQTIKPISIDKAKLCYWNADYELCTAKNIKNSDQKNSSKRCYFDEYSGICRETYCLRLNGVCKAGQGFDYIKFPNAFVGVGCKFDEVQGNCIPVSCGYNKTTGECNKFYEGGNKPDWLVISQSATDNAKLLGPCTFDVLSDSCVRNFCIEDSSYQNCIYSSFAFGNPSAYFMPSSCRFVSSTGE